MAEATLSRPAFVDALVDALERDLPGAHVKFEQVRGPRYRFFVIDPAFDAMGHPQRQRIVWDVARRVVDQSDLFNVAMILTLGHEDLGGGEEPGGEASGTAPGANGP